MEEFETLEFRRMVAISVAFHLVAVGFILVNTVFNSSRYIEAATPGPMNVLWATSVRAPKPTSPNKLPGPMVVPDEVEPPKPAEAKIVMPEDKAKKSKESPQDHNKDDEARKKAMADALASVQHDVEKRPKPRADNFPSQTKGAEEGLPAGPGGGISGMLGGDPVFGGYKRQVQQLITDHFVWIQKRDEASKNLFAEVSFRVDSEGNILEPEVSKSSGNSAFESAALRAIKKSSPLPAPPQPLAADIMREQFVIHFQPSIQ